MVIVNGVEDLVAFLTRCREAIQGDPQALIVVKENIAKEGYVVDKTDSSVTRSFPILQAIFKQAGLRVLRDQRQPGFPRELFAVRLIALEPEQ
jgi:hypothetical protein